MTLSPIEHANTGRCSACRYGAPTIVLCSSMCPTMSEICSSVYPRCRRARGTVWLTIDMVPPPTSFFVLTRPRSGSMPVVSQSIRNEIVPVGARTVACELRTPCSSASSTAESQASCAADSSSVGTTSSSICATAARCIFSTSIIGLAFSWKPANGPMRAAVRADVS